MISLILLNDAPYGSERTYNGLRLALALAQSGDQEVKLFLMGDAVGSAKDNQKVANGSYNLATMLSALAAGGGEIGVCGSCLDSRGISETELVQGTHRSSMEELTSWTLRAHKVVTF